MKWNQRTIWNLIKDDGTLAVGWYKVGDYWYYFNAAGEMIIGWVQDPVNSKWYYLNTDGQMQTGWIRDNGKWYYLNTDGSMYANGSYTIDGKNYSFDSTGAMQETGLSDNGAKFIGSWEGFWSQAQYDPYYPNDERYITVGYGTTYSAMPSAFNSSNPLSTTCTEDQAAQWVKYEATDCANTITADLNSKGVSLNQNELDALISFAYNCGAAALLGSTLYKNIVDGIRDSDTITADFQAWSNANGTRSDGLYKRRTSEAALFLNGDYTGNN
jgi:lysozyme